MEYSLDDLFPEERPDARHALLELFPEEAQELKEKRAEEIWGHLSPKVESMLSTVATAVEEEFETLHELFETHTEENNESFSTTEERLGSIVKKLESVDKLHSSLKGLSKQVDSHKSELKKHIDSSIKTASEVAYRALNLLNSLQEEFSKLGLEVKRAHKRIDGLPDEYDDSKVWSELKKLRQLLLRTGDRGGSIDRNIWIGGNPSVLSRYTDINLVAGSNVTITYQNNDVQKTTDITISATGGSGSGIVRSVNSVATNTAAGAVAGTDYVYLAAGSITITLPTTVGNSNLYTVKNIGAGTVTIATTGGDTIDGSVNLQLPVQFTSVDLVSNNSGNWDIT